MSQRIAMALLACTLLLVGAAGGSLAARSQDNNGAVEARADRQLFAWSKESQSTTSTDFQKLPDMAVTTLGRGSVIVAVSGVFSGAPVDLRVRVDNQRTLEPGSVTLDPGSGSQTFSFTFATDPGSKQIGCDNYEVEWRSTTGEEVTFEKGSIVASYRYDNETSSGQVLACA